MDSSVGGHMMTGWWRWATRDDWSGGNKPSPVAIFANECPRDDITRLTIFSKCSLHFLNIHDHHGEEVEDPRVIKSVINYVVNFGG